MEERFEGTLATPIYMKWESSGITPVVISAGQGSADIPGDTNVCLQAAVDYISGIGGGIVEIRPGRYLMHDSLHLRPNVVLRGSGDDTVLIKTPMVESKLSVPFLGFGHRDVSLDEPDKFRPGMGICIGGYGFFRACATLTFRQGNRFGITRALNQDCKESDTVRNLFPIISGYDAPDCLIENLRIDGSAGENEYIDGCRGGGIFLLASHRTVIRNVTVENYNGDGFSVQQSDDVVIEDCRSLRNTGFGFHPGSGSSRMIIRRISAVDNGKDGIYYCFRTTRGLLVDSEITGSGDNGISIGERDTDNVIRNCRITGSKGFGIYFRPVAHPELGAHRTTIEGCTINGNATGHGTAEVYISDHASDVRLNDNTIGPVGKDGNNLIAQRAT